MAPIVITENLKDELIHFLKKNKKADLTTTYLYYLDKKFNIKPILYGREKMLYLSSEELISALESQGKLWRETEIKIQFGKPTVNEETTKIYICPFGCGKIYANNFSLNALDEMYTHVGKCDKNLERAEGLPIKRFFISEDPDVIKNYFVHLKEPIKKIVFSSAVTGKLFNSKQAVIEDFVKNQIKPFELIKFFKGEYQVDPKLAGFIETQFEDSKVLSFVEAVSAIEEFEPYLAQWQEDESGQES